MAKYKFFADMCIAICIDQNNMKEVMIIGEPKNVFEYIKGEPVNAKSIKAYERDIGSFLFDLSAGCRMLNYLKGSKISVSDGNITCSYLKNVIDKVLSANNINEEEFEWLCNNLEITQTSLINEDFICYQRHLSFSPSRVPNTDQALNRLLNKYIKEDIPMMIVKGRNDTEYAVTDISLVSMVEYYIRLLYSNNLFPRYCLNCGRLFIAKSSLFDVLCSDVCRKQRNSEKLRRYKEKHNDEYEAQYMKIYQKWYSRIRRAKENGQLSGDRLLICNDIFSGFTSASYEKRNDVRNGDISPEAFTRWIDNFEIQMNMFWADIK
ncbi:MAG: helicase associated domain-containing protein [Oscillospiraceae bacterium]|nr:helicase associated domain-containing protein [Oscillospiraceae bacterium]